MLYAKLLTKFNSYHEFPFQINDLITNEEKKIVVYNQFLPPSMRTKDIEIQIAVYPMNSIGWGKIPDLNDFKIISENENVRPSHFLIPVKLFPEYPGLQEFLGKPLEIANGIMSGSGRSIWCFGKYFSPVCIKIDTMQLSDRQFFLERSLSLESLRHSIKITDFLKNESNFLSESTGVHLRFNYLDSEHRQKNYTYLERRFDSKNGLQAWSCDKCSDPECEHKLFTGLLRS